MNDKRLDETTGERMRFTSAILPPYMRRSSKVSEILPLYLPAQILQRRLRPVLAGVLR